MQDLRKIAAERAAKPKGRPVGASFMTEHQRAKKALVKQIEALDGSNIQMIAASTDEDGGENKTLRVAAYCRVSTDDLDQAISIALQIKEYKKKIKANPNWKYVGTYVDDGFSGTNTEHRQGFQKLMADAMDGKIDLIVTKSVQRFGRNTVENLQTMRTLIKSGVVIYFQVENVYSDQSDAELWVSLTSAIAEADNKSHRDDRLWGVRRKVENGTSEMYRRPCYGYVKSADGVLTIDWEKAKVVKEIFKAYLDGRSIGGIRKMLEEKHIPSPTGAAKWPARTIDMLLSNEKYTGEIMLYKTVMVGYPNSHRVVNRDSEYRDRYCITNGVDAIIDEETFRRVQDEKKRRSPYEEGPDGKQRKKTKYSSKRPNGGFQVNVESE